MPLICLARRLIFKNGGVTSLQRILKHQNQVTSMSSFANLRELKRFYKKVGISQSDGVYEILLDKRKLKTPLGNLFTVTSEPLAIAVATEWESQPSVIQRHLMHMTSLCCTAIDNPLGRDKQQIVTSIMHYLDTDTVCFRDEEPPDLAKLQRDEWDPILTWANKHFEVVIQPTTSMVEGPQITQQTREVFTQHLMAYKDAAVMGYESVVQNLKSLLLSAALVNRQVSVEQAVRLARLEQVYQISKWGNVEWAHDLDEADLKARVASAALFIHFNTESTSTVVKQSLSR